MCHDANVIMVLATKERRTPYRYVMIWEQGEKERLAIEARYRNFLKGHGKEESIDLGWVEGTRCAYIHDLASETERKWGGRSDGAAVEVEIPFNGEGEDAARRLSLLATLLREAPETAALERAGTYVKEAPPYEIHFWMSKLLDQELGPQRVIPALLVISRSMRLRPSGKRE